MCNWCEIITCRYAAAGRAGSAASGHPLAPCQLVFRSDPAAQCLRREQLGQQRT